MSKNDLDNLDFLRKIKKKPHYKQRDLARDLNLSLGKVNYCVRELKKRGLIKIKNFKNNPDKVGYLYILTPKGIAEKTRLTLNFMKTKIKEYEELKKELD